MAAIKSAFDKEATLIVGHNGIYEVALEQEIIHTNQNQCCGDGNLSESEIIHLIGEKLDIFPKEGFTSDLHYEEGEAPACPLH